jgi:charged multivesicular body protein 4
LADEIGNAIANGPHAGTMIDEGELDAELDELEQEALDDKMLKTGTVPNLPNNPIGEVKGKSKVAAEEDEEEELRKLQAEMAM